MHKRFSRKYARRTESGITLLEMMIVLAIIAMVTGSLFIWLRGSSEKAKAKTAKVTVSLLEGAYQEWSAEHTDKACPESIEELLEYTTIKEKDRPKIIKGDPWGSAWVLKCTDTESGTEFTVLSVGKDKKEGTKDDVMVSGN